MRKLTNGLTILSLLFCTLVKIQGATIDSVITVQVEWYDSIVVKESIPIVWQNDSTYPWTLTSDGRLKSGNSNFKNSQSEVSFTYSSEYPTSVSFDYSVDNRSSGSYNCLKVEIDSVSRLSYDPSRNSSTKSVTYWLPKGEHTVVFRDTVYGSTGYSSYISNVKVTEYPGATEVEVDSVVVDSASISLDWTLDEDYPWTLTSDGRLKSGNSNFKNSQSEVSFTYSSEYPTSVSFDCSVDNRSSGSYNCLKVEIDSVSRLSYDPSRNSSTKSVTYWLPKGEHTVVFRDTVYGSTGYSSYISNVKVTEYPGATEVEVDSVVVDSASISLDWTLDEDYPWTLTSDGRLKSGNSKFAYSQSELSFTYSSEYPTSVSFNYSVDSRYSSSYNCLKVEIDSVSRLSYDPSRDSSTKSVTYWLPKGEHTVVFRDTVYGSTGYSSYISNVKVAEYPGATDVEVDSVVVDSASISLDWTLDEDYPWTLTSDGRLKSGNSKFAYSQSELSFTYSSEYPTSVSFNYSVDSRYSSSYNCLKVEIDSVSRLSYDPSRDSSTKSVTYWLPKGEHTVVFRDTVYGSTGYSSYISNVKVAEYPGATATELDSFTNACIVPVTWEHDTNYPWIYSDNRISSGNAHFANTTSTIKASFTIEETSRIRFYNYVKTEYYTQGNGLLFSINGKNVYSNNVDRYSYGNGEYYYMVVDPGTYVLEWQYNNTVDHSNNYAYIEDLSITQNWTEVNITPGTLGIEILSKENVLQDVEMLRVSGEMNADDWAIVKQLSNLYAIDLSDAIITEIPDYCFDGWSSMKYIVLPDGIKRIGAYSFRNTQIMELSIPSSLTSIGKYAFYGCANLLNVEIADSSSLQTINSYAFHGCSGLNDIDFSGVTLLETIGDYAFYECRSLKEFIMPNSVTSLGSWAFRRCSSMTKMYFSDNLTYLPDYVCNECVSLKDVHLPNNLKYMYTGCLSVTAIERIVIPSTVTTIDRYVFEECNSLSYVEFPSYVSNSYSCILQYCDNIDTIVCNSPTPPIVSDDILCYSDRAKNDITLIVPYFAINNYKLDPYWYQFGNIQAMNNVPKTWIIGNDMVFYNDTIINDKPNVEITWNSEKGGTFTVFGDKTFSMNSFTMHWSHNNQYISPNDNDVYTALLNNSNLRADSVSISMSTRNDIWTFFTVPFDVKVSEISTWYEGTTNWVIREYSGENRAAGKTDSTWVKLTSDDILEARKGYIIQASRYVGNEWQYYSGFDMPAIENANKNNIFVNQDVTINLNEYLSEFAHNRSWNLVGNPYPCYYDTRHMSFSAPITIWDMNNKTYTAYSIIDDEYVLSPGQAFFVQTPVDNKTIVFSKTGRTINKMTVPLNETRKTANTRGVNVTRSIINITISDSIGSDKTRIVINDNASMQYEMDKDASKFMSDDLSVPQIFTSYAGVNYAINERPMGNGMIELSLRITKDGAYTISMNRDNVLPFDVYLIDTKIDRKVLLSELGDYTFEAVAGEDENRFMIMLSNESISTGVEQVNDMSDSPIYNLQGIKVDKKTLPGIYIQNGKKIIVE